MWRPCPAALHEFTPFKGTHIGSGQVEPFAVLALLCETLVPVRLDAHRIIRADDVHSVRLLRQLQSDLTLASTGSVGAANLVVATRLDKVDEAEIDIFVCVGQRILWRFDHFAELRHVLKVWMRVAVLPQFSYQLCLSPKTSIGFLCGECGIATARELDLRENGKFSEFSRQQ